MLLQDIGLNFEDFAAESSLNPRTVSDIRTATLQSSDLNTVLVRCGEVIAVEEVNKIAGGSVKPRITSSRRPSVGLANHPHWRSERCGHRCRVIRRSVVYNDDLIGREGLSEQTAYGFADQTGPVVGGNNDGEFCHL